MVDTPPGTSDEHLSIVQYMSQSSVDGAVIVTTPQVCTYVCTYACTVVCRVGYTGILVICFLHFLFFPTNTGSVPVGCQEGD